MTPALRMRLFGMFRPRPPLFPFSTEMQDRIQSTSNSLLCYHKFQQHSLTVFSSTIPHPCRCLISMARDSKLSHLQSLRRSIDISEDNAARHEESSPPTTVPRGGGLSRGRRGRGRFHLAPLRMRPRVPLLVLAGEARHKVAVDGKHGLRLVKYD